MEHVFWSPRPPSGITATFVTLTSAQTVWLASSPGCSLPILSSHLKVTLSFGLSDLTDLFRGERGGDGGGAEGENTTRRKVARTFSDMYSLLHHHHKNIIVT